MDASKLMELIKNKKQALKQRVKTIKPNAGANRYVILPGWRKGEEHVYFHDFGQHYVKNAAGELQAVYPCLDKTYGNPCPICDGLTKAIKSTSDDETVKILKEAVSAQVYLLNVLAIDSADPTTPQILEVKKTAFAQINDLIEEWGATVFDPTEAQIVTINRDGTGMNTKYTVQVSPKRHPVPRGVYDKINDLDEYVRQENEEQQRRALTAINNVAGLLPSGATKPSADTPRTAADTIDSGDADLRALEARNAAEATRPAAADASLDAELDALLGDLTGTEA